MRRCTDAKKVWYEWMVESFMEVPGSPPSELSVKLQGERDSALGGDSVSRGYSAQKGESRNRDSSGSAMRSRPSEKKKKKKRVRLGVSEQGKVVMEGKGIIGGLPREKGGSGMRRWVKWWILKVCHVLQVFEGMPDASLFA
ncbi:MAG: hypothetical protein LQ337_002136 [Flavoplaca oasis]|nr:MAG: hypothetical protein LQ337_002136 [Flavoplaca oasis]